MRRSGIPAAILALALLLSGCGGSEPASSRGMVEFEYQT